MFETCWAQATASEQNLVITLIVLLVLLAVYAVLTSCLLFRCCPLRRVVVRHQLNHHRHSNERAPASGWITRVVETPIEREWTRVISHLNASTTAAIAAVAPSTTVIELGRLPSARRLSVSPIQSTASHAGAATNSDGHVETA